MLKPTARYPELDSLRGLAALSVFFGHYFNTFSVKPGWLLAIEHTPLRFFFDAPAAVMFFFLLSGFVLTLPFIKEDKQPIPLLAFYLKRIFRIYPAYIFAITLSLVLKYYFHPENIAPFSEYQRQFWTWHFNEMPKREILKAYLLIGPSFNADLTDGVVWSMVVEMKISFLLPFFIIIVKRTNLLFNLAFLAVLLYAFNYQFLGIFYMGVLLAKYHKPLIAIASKLSKAYIIGLILLSILLYSARFTLNLYTHPDILVSYTIPSYLMAIASGIIIIVVLSKNRFHLFFKQKVFSFFGLISYSFYLLHWPVLLFMLSFISDKVTYNYELIFIATLVLTSILSYAVYKLVELPFQKLATAIVKRYLFFSSMELA